MKTAIHEMAHQKLHALQVQDPNQTRNSKEVEAESVAYTVCQHYGIDTSDYSFSYVVGWSEGKETPELKASLETIRKTAAELIHAIDEKLKDLQTEKTKEQTKEMEKPLAEEQEGAVAESKSVYRRKELSKLVNETAEQCSADAPKKKPSVRDKLQEEREKATKTPVKKTKSKTKEAELGV